jgi:hypothetical protein
MCQPVSCILFLFTFRGVFFLKIIIIARDDAQVRLALQLHDRPKRRTREMM